MSTFLSKIFLSFILNVFSWMSPWIAYSHYHRLEGSSLLILLRMFLIKEVDKILQYFVLLLTSWSGFIARSRNLGSTDYK